MSLTIESETAPIAIDDHGVARVGGTRVRLATIVGAYQQGSPAEEIVHRYPSVDLADVHAVISYYLRHKSEVDTYLRAQEQEADRLRRNAEAIRLLDSWEADGDAVEQHETMDVIREALGPGRVMSSRAQFP